MLISVERGPPATSDDEEQKATWKKGRPKAEWIGTFETDAVPFLSDLPVDEMEGLLLRKVLLPIWLEVPETARLLHQRTGAVLD